MSQPFRIGLGHDTHRLEPGRGLILGGVTIEHDRKAVGHSDADVLLHAITDAILGAAAIGDIGELFPDTDPTNKGRDSTEMLKIAMDHARESGWKIGNLDCVIFAQRPEILPHRDTIRRRIADVAGIDITAVWLKAKTGEGVGPIGRQEAISAECAVLLTQDL